MAQGQGRSPGQTVKLLYIRDYLRAETDLEHGVIAEQIQDYLASKGIKASLKTIYNDIKVLQSEAFEPIEYSFKMKAYHIVKPAFQPHELRLMVDSVQASRFITQQEARNLTQKIQGLTDKYTKESLNRTAFVADRVRNKNESVVRDTDKLHRAISEDRKIGFKYFHYRPDKTKAYSKGGERYVVSPYALHWDNGNYYLYAFVDGKFRSFRVDRMEQITDPLPIHRDGKDQYRQTALTSRRKAKVFGMYHGDPYTVRIRFQNRFVDAVYDMFGREVLLIPVDKDHFTVAVDVEISPPFFAWVSTFGKSARILSPAPVVEQMKKFIENVALMYKDEGEK